MLLNEIDLLNSVYSMIQVSNFFYFFKNLSVALTLFFLCQEKFGIAYGIAPTTDISLLGSFFLFFFKFNFFFYFSFQYLVHYN
jgi:hypothetical protein